MPRLPEGGWGVSDAVVYGVSSSCYSDKSFRYIVSSVVSALYSGKPPCLNFHQATLSAVNDATASPPFSALLMKIYSAEFHQI